MSPTFFVKERDERRYDQGEIVKTTLEHWVQPLTDDLNNATIGGYACREPYMVNEGTEDIYRYFPELSIHRRFARHYSAQFTIRHDSDTDRPYYVLFRMGDRSKTAWRPTLTISQRRITNDSRKQHILYQKTWGDGDVTFPIEGVFPFYPLSTFVLVPLIRDGIRQGYLPKDEQHLKAGGIFTPQIKHTLRTLQGLERKYAQLLDEVTL